jgi:hypothetical protein
MTLEKFRFGIALEGRQKPAAVDRNEIGLAEMVSQPLG